MRGHGKYKKRRNGELWKEEWRRDKMERLRDWRVKEGRKGKKREE